MQATLQVTKKLIVTPLIDMQNPAFADTYSKGLWWAMHGDYTGEKPVPDSYLVENLKREVGKGTLDVQQVGLYFGMLHGSILEPQSGQLRPDLVTVVTFTNPNAKRGYSVARRDHFYYADETRIQTDSALIEELFDMALDLMGYPDEHDSWYYAIGCLLGDLSILLFPTTDQEWQYWEAEHRALLVVE